MSERRRVVFALPGVVLDKGRGPERWERWRPTVDLCRHADLPVDRLELLVSPREGRLAELLAGDVARISPATQVRIHPVAFQDPWDFEAVYGALHDVCRSYSFDPEGEDYLVHITTGSHVVQICLFLLAEARYLPGRLLQTSPPKRRGSTAGPGSYTIIDLDLARYDRLASRFRRETREGLSVLKGGIVTKNRTFNDLIERVEHVALAARSPLLLTGPTGAGKSLLARRIYELKRARHRLTGPFVEVNCATLRGEQAMSALFGHVRGAFTGALADRAGLLRAADGGVLFLDEVGELGPDEQAMLLRALEEKRFLPVGSDVEVSSDFGLVAGTNRDLPALVARGGFREDLLARIDLWTFRLPGLRDRPEDVEPNLDFELDEFARRSGERVTMNAEARRRFLEFATAPDTAWRANFRDFAAAVTRMATLAPGGRVVVPLVAEEIERLERNWAAATGGGAEPVHADETLLLPLLGAQALDDLDLFDRTQLAFVIRVCRGCSSLSEAGRRLFAASRGRRRSSNDADRVRKYLARFGVAWRDVVGRGDRS